MGGVAVRFWDGLQQYEGHVRQLTSSYMLARVRIFDERDDTIMPRDDIVARVIKRLQGRVLPFEIRKGKLQADLLARLEKVSRDPSHPRRVVVRAAFSNPENVEKTVLSKLQEETRRID